MSRHFETMVETCCLFWWAGFRPSTAGLVANVGSINLADGWGAVRSLKWGAPFFQGLFMVAITVVPALVFLQRATKGNRLLGFSPISMGGHQGHCFSSLPQPAESSGKLKPGSPACPFRFSGPSAEGDTIDRMFCFAALLQLSSPFLAFSRQPGRCTRFCCRLQLQSSRRMCQIPPIRQIRQACIGFCSKGIQN